MNIFKGNLRKGESCILLILTAIYSIAMRPAGDLNIYQIMPNIIGGLIITFWLWPELVKVELANRNILFTTVAENEIKAEITNTGGRNSGKLVRFHENVEGYQIHKKTGKMMPDDEVENLSEEEIKQYSGKDKHSIIFIGFNEIKRFKFRKRDTAKGPKTGPESMELIEVDNLYMIYPYEITVDELESRDGVMFKFRINIKLRVHDAYKIMFLLLDGQHIDQVIAVVRNHLTRFVSYRKFKEIMSMRSEQSGTSLDLALTDLNNLNKIQNSSGFEIVSYETIDVTPSGDVLEAFRDNSILSIEKAGAKETTDAQVRNNQLELNKIAVNLEREQAAIRIGEAEKAASIRSEELAKLTEALSKNPNAAKVIMAAQEAQSRIALANAVSKGQVKTLVIGDAKPIIGGDDK